MPTPEKIFKPVSATAAPKDKIEVLAHVKSGKMKGRKITVLLDADDIVKDQVGGFIKFIREHAIVGLAVGFVIGSQTQLIVKQLTEGFIVPLFNLILGGTKLNDRTATVHLNGNDATFLWGAMAHALLNLLVVLAIVYAIIKVLKLDKVDLPKPVAVPASTKKTKKPAPKATSKTASNNSPTE